MTMIDQSKPVMVTGATGYVAGWLVRQLLEAGLTVHAAVRNPNRLEKISHLEEIAKSSGGTIKYFKADLLEAGSYANAMEGCELVYHTASPFTSNFEDPQRDLVDPAVLGTQNVLEQANETASVKRVVLTSSCASIYTDATELKETPNGIFTEEVWNTTASLAYQPYSYSKTMAERAAWTINEKQDRWDLVVVNPCLVMGPPLNPRATTSESFNLIKQLGDGTLKSGVPNVGIGLVDVRDVADAHFQAGFRPEAEGRHITCGHNTSFLEIAKALQPKYGQDYPVPKKALPKWLVVLAGPLMDKSLDRKFLRNNVNHPWRADNSKSREKLGVTYRPMQETMEDSFAALIDAGVF
jgi:nucleoside-diphosphate-sugar epimerase